VCGCALVDCAHRRTSASIHIQRRAMMTSRGGHAFSLKHLPALCSPCVQWCTYRAAGRGQEGGGQGRRQGPAGPPQCNQMQYHRHVIHRQLARACCVRQRTIHAERERKRGTCIHTRIHRRTRRHTHVHTPQSQATDLGSADCVCTSANRCMTLRVLYVCVCVCVCVCACGQRGGRADAPDGFECPHVQAGRKQRRHQCRH
jgi:hypothetical protein